VKNEQVKRKGLLCLREKEEESFPGEAKKPITAENLLRVNKEYILKPYPF